MTITVPRPKPLVLKGSIFEQKGTFGVALLRKSTGGWINDLICVNLNNNYQILVQYEELLVITWRLTLNFGRVEKWVV